MMSCGESSGEWEREISTKYHPKITLSAENITHSGGIKIRV